VGGEAHLMLFVAFSGQSPKITRKGTVRDSGLPRTGVTERDRWPEWGMSRFTLAYTDWARDKGIILKTRGLEKEASGVSKRPRKRKQARSGAKKKEKYDLLKRILASRLGSGGSSGTGNLLLAKRKCKEAREPLLVATKKKSRGPTEIHARMGVCGERDGLEVYSTNLVEGCLTSNPCHPHWGGKGRTD